MSKIVDRLFNTTLTQTDSSAQEELGGFRFEDGNIYKYVYFSTDAVAAIVGGPVLYDGTSTSTVTVDISHGAGTGSVAGVILAANSTDTYGWIQIHGPASVRITDYVSQGVSLIASADNIWAAGTISVSSDAATATILTGHQTTAVALEDAGTDEDSTIYAFIRCM